MPPDDGLQHMCPKCGKNVVPQKDQLCGDCVTPVTADTPTEQEIKDATTPKPTPAPSDTPS